MAIISAIGRKQWKVRWLFFGIYAFLLIGGATMVYPFLLMLSGSTKSAMDIQFFDAWPRFLHDDGWMCAKHFEGLFNERLMDMNICYDRDEMAFNKMTPSLEHNDALAGAWEEFLDATPLPAYAYAPGYIATPISRTIPSALREFKQELAASYGKDILAVNRELGTEFAGWYGVYVIVPSYLMRREKPLDTPYVRALNSFTGRQPYGLRYYFSPQGFYKKQFLKTQYSQDIAQYNRSHGTAYASWDDVVLPRRYPVAGTRQEQDDWLRFVKSSLALHWLRVDPAAAADFQNVLRLRHGDIASLNRLYGSSYASFADVPIWDDVPSNGVAQTDWEAFIGGYRDPASGQVVSVAREHLRIHSVEFMFQDWLLAKYGSVAAAATALGASWRGLEDVVMPQWDCHLRYFTQNVRALRWEFVTRNYRAVADYLLFHGRGIFNTIVYCGLAILTALLVNPLAAYAMSRYRMPTSYKILLFLMCTMAFPAMVTAIPSFIMLRQLNLLNTFAALILPGMANGYSIFLLKGFFDSLPNELYESAQLDGANEWVLFWQITMSLSKPILAVIALNAFTAAYSNFMFAFVVCQDRKMWTMMVWLYELQQSSGQAVMYASLVIAAIPTFLIFLFCQNVIMRGIVVPSEK